jgi:hypothetical protein
VRARPSFGSRVIRPGPHNFLQHPAGSASRPGARY